MAEDRIEQLAKRLDELCTAVTEGPEGWHREFTMRIPAEPNRDADIVLQRSAQVLREMREALKSEADYCYGWAEHYAATNPERAARHRERGDRLSAAIQGATQ